MTKQLLHSQSERRRSHIAPVAFLRVRKKNPPVNFAADFGRNLASCRKRAGLSQEELAVRASLHRTAVGQLERGERVARVDTLIKLAGSLGLPPGELLTGLGWEPGGTQLGRFRSQQARDGAAGEGRGAQAGLVSPTSPA
jgi:transcriptional regulator with XRE-family HTH domain